MRIAAWFCLIVAVVPGCRGDDGSGSEPGAAETTAEPRATASSTASASAKVEAVDYGPMVTIPAGHLLAGSRCVDIPRIRPDELEVEDVSMGEFAMDVYPYPNVAGQEAKLNVTWSDAKKLCEERGKRLCSELEWERACKGPKNARYPWGEGFKGDRCVGQKDNKVGARQTCKSEFGVDDMIGVALEWTSSSWERGTATGERVVRGARPEMVSWLSARCTHSRKRDPNITHDNVGFRCCSGEPNAAKVVLEQRKRATIEEEPEIDTQFEMALMKAMPRDHRGIVGVELSFDKVYRWHPEPNEEMLIARWRGEPQEGEPFYELAVLKLCGEVAWLTARMRGPAARIGKPKVGISPRKLSFDVQTEDNSGEVAFAFWHGSVKVVQPDWVKTGNELKVQSKPRVRLPKLRSKTN